MRLVEGHIHLSIWLLMQIYFTQCDCVDLPHVKVHMVTKLGFAYKCRYLFFSRGGGPTDCPRDNCVCHRRLSGDYMCLNFPRRREGMDPPPPGPPSRSVDDLAMVKSKDLASAPLWHVVDTLSNSTY